MPKVFGRKLRILHNRIALVYYSALFKMCSVKKL